MYGHGYHPTESSWKIEHEFSYLSRIILTAYPGSPIQQQIVVRWEDPAKGFMILQGKVWSLEFLNLHPPENENITKKIDGWQMFLFFQVGSFFVPCYEGVQNVQAG